MAKMLAVPYRSQEDPDAKLATTDCGATCVAMLLDAYGNFVEIDKVFKETKRPSNEFLSREDMIKASNKFGLRLHRYNFRDQNFLKRSIDNNKPFIALIHYEAWVDAGLTQSKTFKSAHFVVVTGYDGDDVFVNDPLYWGHRRGEGNNKRMTYAQFASAWGTASNFPGNPDFSGLIPTEPMVEPVPPVSQEVINRILAWAFVNQQNVNAETLAQKEVADIFLQFMGNWGDHVVEHEVQANEDLGLVALKYYGDPLKWKVITLFNGLPPINAFEEGDVLKIPEPTNL